MKLEAAPAPSGPVPVEPSSPHSQDSAGFSPPAAATSLHTPPLSPDVGLDSTRPDSVGQSHSNTDLEASMTVVGDPGSITLAEHTLVEEMQDSEDSDEGKRRVKGASAGSFSFVQTEVGALEAAANPLAEEEEEDIVEVKGKPLAFHHNEEVGKGTGIPMKTRSRKASHLRLDLPTKEGSAPWEQIDPPLTNLKGSVAEYYSPTVLQQKTGKAQRRYIPKSSFYFGPPAPDAAYGSAPIGHIGIHHPREILRVERDYTGGELIQFAAIYPLELEGRITPTQFLESINAINELLIAAFSLRHTFLDNMLAVFTLHLSKLVKTPHFEKEMTRLKQLIEQLNSALYNPVGLNILWPRNVAFLFLEIEYY